MSASAAILLGVFLSAGDGGGEERTERRPPRIEPFVRGIDRASTAPANGVLALRAPIEGRVRIVGGRFVMGSNEAEMQQALKLCQKEPFADFCEGSLEFGPAQLIRAEGHVHDVTLSDYEIDRLEVSVARYARCVAAGACTPPSFPSGDPRFDRPNFPVTHVRWDDAVAYCTWVGGRLPTEAEWEHAARGRQGHTFPWGELYNPHLANHGSFADEPTDGRDGYIGLAPVGSFPDGATPTGIYDMAGNASEWVHDWYDLDDTRMGYPRAAQQNPKGPVFGLGHVVRGGSHRSAAWLLRTAARIFSLQPGRDIGFRCAYDANKGP